MRLGRLNAAILAVGAIAVGVRLVHVFSESLWQDEVASARILREPTFGAMLHRVVHTESTPPLWYSLGWTMHALGSSILDVRLLSVAAGGLAAALVVAFGRRVAPLRSAVLAGLLLALGRGLLVHGHELRAYALLSLVVVVFALLLVHTSEEQSPALLVALAACTCCGLLTHYFFCFSLGCAVVWLAVEPTLRGRRRRPLAALGGGVLLASPWLPAAVMQYGQDRFWWIGPFSLRIVVDTPLRLFAPVAHPRPVEEACGAAFAALCVAGGARLWRASAQGRLTVLLAFGPLLAAATLWAAGMRIYALRNLTEIGPFAAVLAATALAHVPRPMRVAAPALAVTGLCAALIAFGASGDTAPYDTIASALVREGWNAHDPIAVFGGQTQFFSFRSPLEWYLPRQPRLALARTTARPCSTVFAIVSSPVSARQLERLGGSRSHWIDGYDVMRLRLAGRHDPGALRTASLITSTVDHSRCVSPVLTGHDAPLA